MDYSVLRRRETGESTVVVVAVKSDIVDFYKEVAEAAGLRHIALEVSPFAHFNSAGLDDLVGREGVNALLDIGGQTAEIAIRRDADLVFTRSAFIGSETLVKARAAEVHVEDARHRLRRATEDPASPESEKLRQSPDSADWPDGR